MMNKIIMAGEDNNRKIVRDMSIIIMEGNSRKRFRIIQEIGKDMGIMHDVETYRYGIIIFLNYVN